jgi:hypothetical protein
MKLKPKPTAHFSTFGFAMAALIALTACNSIPDNSTQANLEESTNEDTGQVVVLFPVTDSIYFGGCITKVIYPSNRKTCKDSLTNYSFDCDGSWQKIHVPCNYLRTDYLQYIEGQILTIHYPDSSTISILCGSNMDIGITDNKTKGLHYKKVIIKGYQLIYEDVPRQKLRLFNNAFELLNRDIK